MALDKNNVDAKLFLCKITDKNFASQLPNQTIFICSPAITSKKVENKLKNMKDYFKNPHGEVHLFYYSGTTISRATVFSNQIQVLYGFQEYDNVPLKDLQELCTNYPSTKIYKPEQRLTPEQIDELDFNEDNFDLMKKNFIRSTMALDSVEEFVNIIMEQNKEEESIKEEPAKEESITSSTKDQIKTEYVQYYGPVYESFTLREIDKSIDAAFISASDGPVPDEPEKKW